MSDPSPSPPHQHPTPTLTPSPHDDHNHQTTENPENQHQTPHLVVDQQDQQQEEEQPQKQGTGSCFTVLPSSIDLPTPIADTHVSNPDTSTSLTSITPTLRRLPSKRKKGKANMKRQQAIDKKYQTLIEKLKPLPFKPSKNLDFTKHEKLLKRLGLWDFVQIEFDWNIRVELIAQLVASYDPKLRCSYVNEHRILVNRADLARAFKLPVKKEKGGDWSVVVDDVELDPVEGLVEEDSIEFVENFVSNWVLLHEDTWMMPSEVLNWMKVIKDGHPEKVDWAGLFWFMVEKELMQGEQLENCYYGSHLQYLIKSQREAVLLKGEPEKVELDAVEKEEEVGFNEGDANVGSANECQEENAVIEGPTIELTLVQEGGQNEQEVSVEKSDVRDSETTAEKGGVRDLDTMDIEEGNAVEDAEEQEQWLFDGKSKISVQFLQPCNLEARRTFDNYEGGKEENEEIVAEAGEEVAGVGYDIVPNNDTLEGEGLTGNLLQALETTEIAYNSPEQRRDQSSMELLAAASDMHHSNLAGHSLYDNGCKRDIEHEFSLSDQSLNGGAKRLRIDGPWDNMPSDFGACMNQMHQLVTRARLMYEEKEQAEEHSNMNQQMLLNELHRRESVIEHLQKTKYEEIQKRDNEIARLERELYLFDNIVDGYRKALKETDRAFSEYRQHFQVHEESIYKEVGPGGLMLSTGEIERRRVKQEEEEKANYLMLEQKAKEAEEEYTIQFTEWHDKVHLLDKRLEGLEKEMKRLKELYSSGKGAEAEDQVSENPECPRNDDLSPMIESK